MAKLDGKSLMIGDWVQPCSRSYPVQVESLSADTINGDMDATFDPIPLTPEILKKNGFEYFHKNFASLDHDSAFRIEMVNWPDEFGNGGLWVFAELIKIRYVHDLQHCLRLCKINKEIVL